jgi:hypothetical protein
MIAKKNRLESPLRQQKIESFINNISKDEVEHIEVSNKTQPVNITLSKRDLVRLDNQIDRDRAIKLGLRTKISIDQNGFKSFRIIS